MKSDRKKKDTCRLGESPGLREERVTRSNDVVVATGTA